MIKYKQSPSKLQIFFACAGIFCAVIALICLLVYYIASMSERTQKANQENTKNACNAICNNDQVVSCNRINYSLVVVCVPLETKNVRVVEIKE